jgi:hypothetical protein
VYRPIKGATKMFHSDSLSQPLIRTNIYLSKSQRELLKSLAAAMDISAAELARRILEKGLRVELKRQK